MELEYDWWQYFLIPWIAGFVGYFTNVLALQMTFYPIEFFGIELFRIKGEPWALFGWQGIIPTKAKKMASISFDLFTRKLLKIQEAFSRLDPVRFAEAMEDATLLILDTVINEVAMEYMPDKWETIDREVKNDIIVTTNTDSGAFIANFIKDMRDHAEDVVDIKHLAVDACVKNKHLIVKIFQECGENEFTFIRRSGFYFGFLFGLFQMLVWFFYQGDWILPVAGFLVGWFTNYVALKVIFRPLEPRTFLCWKIQGIFLRRQKEVSAVYSRVIMTEILHVKAMWDAIFTGPLSSNFFALLRAHTLVFIDQQFAEIKPIAVAAMGAQKFAQMKEDIARKVAEALPSFIDNSYEYTQEALDLENTLRTRMQEITPEEFEGVLHPAFQEDEIELIALGGVLGGIVGVIQLFTLFQ